MYGIYVGNNFCLISSKEEKKNSWNVWIMSIKKNVSLWARYVRKCGTESPINMRFFVILSSDEIARTQFCTNIYIWLSRRFHSLWMLLFFFLLHRLRFNVHIGLFVHLNFLLDKQPCSRIAFIMVLLEKKKTNRKTNIKSIFRLYKRIFQCSNSQKKKKNHRKWP